MIRPVRLALALLLNLAACTAGTDTAAPASTDTGKTPEETGLPSDTGAHTADSGETACDSAAQPDSAETGQSPADSDSATSTPGDSATDTGATASPDSGADSAADSGADSAADSATDSGDSGMPLPSGPVTIYAVRHAEKADDSDDPGLTEEGTARAEALAVLLHDAPLAAVFATELRRTQETVQPTADDHGLTVDTTYDPEEELAAHILSTYGDQEVLTAGHSYTLPDFFEALGLDPVPEVDDYGQLWIITIATDGSATCVESTYGE